MAPQEALTYPVGEMREFTMFTEDGDGQLSVDADGRGTEPFGVAKITWQ